MFTIYYRSNNFMEAMYRVLTTAVFVILHKMPVIP